VRPFVKLKNLVSCR